MVRPHLLSAGSFGIIEEKGLKMFLKRLQEDQQDMLDLIQEREKARKKGLQEAALPALRMPGPAVQWDVGEAPSPLARRTGPPTPFEASRPGPQEPAEDASAQPARPGKSEHPHHHLALLHLFILCWFTLRAVKLIQSSLMQVAA